MSWLDEHLYSKMGQTPFEVYTYRDDRSTYHIGVRNLLSEFVVHYEGEIVLYGPASYRECCEYSDDVMAIIFKRNAAP